MSVWNQRNKQAHLHPFGQKTIHRLLFARTFQVLAFFLAYFRGFPFSLHITVKLSLDPCHQQFYDAFLFILRQLPSHRDVIPLMQASAAAAGAGVLGDKHRMPAHRRLLAVIGDACRCKPRSDEVGSMALNGLHTLVRYVLPVLFAQMELRAE